MTNISVTTLKILTFITTFNLFIFIFAIPVNSQMMEGTLEMKSGAIFIEPPETFNLDTWFIPTDTTGSYNAYTTLSPANIYNQLKINDYDTGGTNFKISISASNLSNMEIPHAIIPYTNFGLVTLASNAQDGIDSIANTADLSGITLPAVCRWNTQSGTLEENCDSKLTERMFIGNSNIITNDPANSVDETETIIQVTNSTDYQQGDILLIENELMLVTETPTTTSIEVIRGISKTSASSHPTNAQIKNMGSQSLEQDIFLSSEETTRAAIFTMGFGVRTLLEPSLNLHPGNYGGTITFSLYTCATNACL